MDKTKNTREMESHVKALQDQLEEEITERKPYHTPELTRLGTVKEVTQGLPPSYYPDDFGISN